MRILDSKDAGDKALVADAPTIEPFLTPGAAAFYEGLKRHLDRLKVPYRQNWRIVRGLDYYSHTAFEFVTDRLGAQGTVLAGGRYDGLISEMGGPSTPAIGWAAGIERLAELIAPPPAPQPPVVVIPVGDANEARAHDLVQLLREAGVRTEMGYRGNMKRRLERANKLGAQGVVFVEDESYQLKNMTTGEQAAKTVEELLRDPGLN